MPSSSNLDALLKSKPKTPRGERTLGSLCDVAESLFAEKSYYSASVSEIVAEAGISVGTFYIYFPDKLSVYRYVLMRLGHRIRKFIATRLISMNLQDRSEMEREGIKAFLDFCVDHPSAFSIVWQSLFVAPDLFIAYYDDFSRQYQGRLQQAADAGEIQPLDLEVVSYALMGITNFLALKYTLFAQPQKINDAELYRVVDQILRILKSGLYIQSQEDGD